MPILSILIPCFNVQKYVSQCLESIKHQSFRDFEAFCINDGSTDNTFSEIQKTIGTDSRFHIINKPNSGYGASLNLGLQKAKGKYIGIIESDDFADPDMFRLLVTEAEKNNLDICKACFYRFIDGRDYYDDCKFLEKDNIFKPLENLATFRHPPSIWAAIYRRDLLEKYGIHFLQTPGASFQDISFAFKTNLVANRIKCLKNPLVHYRIHNSNSVKKASNPYVVFTEYDECINFAKRLNLYEYVKPIMLPCEYATFKWNFLRVDAASAHEFYLRWVKRWANTADYFVEKLSKYGCYYFLITHFPFVFEKYLENKRR